MPAPFHQLSLEEFIDLFLHFPFTRRINAVHMHHTWRPDHGQYQGLATIEAMRRFHVQERGFSDIAQHITIAPDGSIWTGRNWNQSPASAVGHNGNGFAGPFMFEMIGDFDQGRDPFQDPQKGVALQVIAQIQERFHLSVDSLKFHNQMSTKTCPGSSINYSQILEEVRRLREDLTRGGETQRAIGVDSNGERALKRQTLILNLSQDLAREELTETEPPEETMTPQEIHLATDPTEGFRSRDGSRGPGGARGIDPEMLRSFRPHVINLNQGQFSTDGIYVTTEHDVDAMFGEHLPRALREAEARNEKLRIVIYAHGGLVSEEDGLRIVAKQLPWWKANRIYPICFVWETGFLETIGQLMRGEATRAIGARDIFDRTTDPILEAFARRFGGLQIWSGIKRSAELASAPEGGARLIARRLKVFCDANPGKVELHAAGHSAGSNFLSHFIPAALDEGTPHFTSAHFLAPAVRVDAFLRQLKGRIGNGLDRLSIFTMAQDWERDDQVLNLYQKSLLYLIHFALEPELRAPILGLDESLRADRETARLFGLGGNPPGLCDVVFSKSRITSGRNASTATTHGAFDDDAPTMNSVLRRVKGLSDTDPIVGYNDAGVRSLELIDRLASELNAPPSEAVRPGTAAPTQTMFVPAAPGFLRPKIGVGNTNEAGRKLALCVGIDRYPRAPLAGCVADAQNWAGLLSDQGFLVNTLFNEQATQAAIRSELTRLIQAGRPGDVLVFQYAGHGTQVPDLNGDESNGDSPGQDEAMCPVDFDLGRLLIDDDFGTVFDTLAPNVNLTCFIDCCHSGTISRAMTGTPAPTTDEPAGEMEDRRRRFVVLTGDEEKAYRRERENQSRSRNGHSRAAGQLKEVVFTACHSTEVAWESNGHGDFTTRATSVLRQARNGVTNDDFIRSVTAAFGANPRQNPQLDCDEALRRSRLLQAIG